VPVIKTEDASGRGVCYETNYTNACDLYNSPNILIVTTVERRIKVAVDTQLGWRNKIRNPTQYFGVKVK
jgi:hypothetical protein